MFDKLKVFALEQVLWAEKNLKGKSGAEKKAAVVKKLDDLITLPAYLEWADDMVISYLVDSVCEKLNMLEGHNFGDTEISKQAQEEIIENIEVKQ